MLTIKCWHAKKQTPSHSWEIFELFELWNQGFGLRGWGKGGGGRGRRFGSWKVARIQTCGGCRAGSTIWARAVEENTFFFFFETEICSHKGRNVHDHKTKDSASKVLQGAVKECFGWRLVQALPTFNRCSGKTLPGKLQNPNREVYKLQLPQPGCRLFTLKSSVVTPKISPSARNWYSVQNKQRRVPTREPDSRATRLRRVKYIRIGKRKRRNAPFGNDWGGAGCVFTARIQHCRTKWNAGRQSVTRNVNSFDAGMHVCHNIGRIV